MNVLRVAEMTEILAAPLCQQITLVLLHFLWQGLAVAAALWLLVQGRGIRGPRSRYAASLIALGLMVICPIATWGWLAAHSESTAIARAPRSEYAAAAIDPALPAPALSAAAVEILSPLQPYALLAWMLGVTIFAVRLSLGVVGARRMKNSLIPLPLELAAVVERLGCRMQLDALPLVFLSGKAAEAMAVGLLRPLVLIPAAWATELPPALLEAVIAHELAHIRRHDLWVNFCQRLVETLFFYHPAVWWLSRRLRIERELCADELAVMATGRRLQYAEALEQVALRRRAEFRPALAAFIRGERNMRLLERVRNVLGLTAADRSRLWPAGLLMLVLPLGVWACALGLTATADDERKEEREAEVEREEISEEEKFFGKKRFDRADREEEEEEEPRKEKDDAREDDGDAREDDEPRKEGDRPRKEGPRDGDVKKEGPRDGDKPRKDFERDDDDQPFKKPIPGHDDVVAELKGIVAKLMAENQRLREELAAARGGKEFFEKKDVDKRELLEKERNAKREALLKHREAAERLLKEARAKVEALTRELEEERDISEKKDTEAADKKEAPEKVDPAADKKEREEKREEKEGALKVN